MADERSPVDFMTPLAASSLAVCPWFFALYYANRRVYPLAQREPAITLIGNVAFWIASQVWMLELRHWVPCFVDVFDVQILVGITMVCFSMKVWKIFLDAGLTSELERSKFGWFVAHRSWRSRKSLYKVALAMITFHICIFIYVANSVSDELLRNAINCDTTTSNLVFGGLGALYCLLFIIASCLLAKVRDGFFIKSELRMVGIGSGFIAIGWMVRIAADLPCGIYECNTTLLWCCWLALFLTSTIYPLSKAMFERKFIWWWDFCRKSEAHDHDKNGSEASTHSSGGSYGESDVKPPVARNPVRALATQLNPKDPNLVRFRRLPLTKILATPSGKEAFRRFTVMEFSVENLLFVEAVTKYRALADPTKDDMLELFDKYISNTAPSQVNLPNQIVRKMQGSLEMAQGIEIRAYFDEAYDHVMKLMQRDSYRRFQNTTEFVAVAATLGDAELNECVPSDTLGTSLMSEGSSDTKLTPQTPHTPLSFPGDATQSFDSEGLPEPLGRKKVELEEIKGDGSSPRRSTVPRKSSAATATATPTAATTSSTAVTTPSAAESRRQSAGTSPTAAASASTSSVTTVEAESPRRKSTIKENIARKQSNVIPPAAVQEEEEAAAEVAVERASVALEIAPPSPTTVATTPSISPTRKVSNIFTRDVTVQIGDSSSESRGSVKDSYQLLQ